MIICMIAGLLSVGTHHYRELSGNDLSLPGTLNILDLTAA